MPFTESRRMFWIVEISLPESHQSVFMRLKQGRTSSGNYLQCATLSLEISRFKINHLHSIFQPNGVSFFAATYMENTFFGSGLVFVLHMIILCFVRLKTSWRRRRRQWSLAFDRTLNTDASATLTPVVSHSDHHHEKNFWPVAASSSATSTPLLRHQMAVSAIISNYFDTMYYICTERGGSPLFSSYTFHCRYTGSVLLGSENGKSMLKHSKAMYTMTFFQFRAPNHFNAKVLLHIYVRWVQSLPHRRVSITALEIWVAVRIVKTLSYLELLINTLPRMNKGLLLCFRCGKCLITLKQASFMP